MYNKIKKYLKYSYDAAVNTINHDGVEHAGYMAFLSVLSIFPFMIFIVSLVGAIGDSAIGEDFIKFIYSILPKNISVSMIEPRIKEILLGPPQALLNLALFGVVWTASSSVEGLRTILNRIYKITAPPSYIWRRILSIIQFLFLSILVIATIFLLIIAPSIVNKISAIIGSDTNLIKLQDFAGDFSYLRYFMTESVLFFVVLTIYYVIPNVKLTIKSLLPGAILVAILWSIGGAVLSFYLTYFKQINLIYGSLAGVIASLLFFYIMNLILIYGAEFNYILSNKD